MPWYRLIPAILIVAVLASGLHVPVIYHGHPESAESDHVHLVVHRHHGRVHVHVHHHGPEDHGHHDAEHHGETHGCESEHCESDHGPEIWLSSAKDNGWRQVLGLLRLAESHPFCALPAEGATREFGQGLGRSPPEVALPPAHLCRLRPVILRL